MLAYLLSTSGRTCISKTTKYVKTSGWFTLSLSLCSSVVIKPSFRCNSLLQTWTFTRKWNVTSSTIAWLTNKIYWSKPKKKMMMLLEMLLLKLLLFTRPSLIFLKNQLLFSPTKERIPSNPRFHTTLKQSFKWKHTKHGIIIITQRILQKKLKVTSMEHWAVSVMTSMRRMEFTPCFNLIEVMEWNKCHRSFRNST